MGPTVRIVVRLLVFCLASALLACSTDASPDDLNLQFTEAPPETVSPTTPGPATAGDCANEATVISDRSLQNGPTVTGDIDGDGFTDDIYIEVDRNSQPPCSAFVVGHTRGGDAAAPIWELGSAGGLPTPRIHGLVDIDGDGASEVLVDEAMGASTQFVGAFTDSGGDLKRLAPSEKDAGPQEISGLFGYGGSVGHLEGVGCAADGIVVSSAVPGTAPDEVADGIYVVDRRFFTLNEARLTLDHVEKRRLPAAEVQTLPEYSGGPFANC